MSIENIVRNRVQKFKDNQERLIQEDKIHESKSLFGGFSVALITEIGEKKMKNSLTGM
jgi:hypothetical protein|tara:strand:- start:1006 stop:1179 length:174 start_codon:yes stop_codon:yes gene_type:complete